MADSIATAADYADAIMAARRAKNCLFLILLLILLAQLTIFFVGRYANVGLADATTDATTQPVLQQAWRPSDLLRYLVGVAGFLGVAMTIVLATVLLLIVKIMLVGRLIGVARLTSAFIWTIVLAVLLFPWQAFLGEYAFKIPGVLYTWDELARHVNFPGEFSAEGVLKWARFVGFPVAALVILLSIQIRSNRGLRQALGEATYDTPGNTPLR